METNKKKGMRKNKKMIKHRNYPKNNKTVTYNITSGEGEDRLKCE